MRVVGVDLAAQPKKTGLCVMDASTRPRVVELVSRVDDDQIVAMAQGADGVGLDCPLGWPEGFVDLVSRHHKGEPIADHPAAPRELRLRVTDDHTRAVVGRDPLSVSTDKLGIVALRGVRILERLAGPGADRSGGDGIYEVYPAGALRLWDLPSTGYKGRDGAAARREIVGGLAHHVDLADTDDRLIENDDELDAVICALLTSLARRGRTVGPGPDQAEIAAREGWIHLPAGPLDTSTRFAGR